MSIITVSSGKIVKSFARISAESVVSVETYSMVLIIPDGIRLRITVLVSEEKILNRLVPGI